MLILLTQSRAKMDLVLGVKVGAGINIKMDASAQLFSRILIIFLEISTPATNTAPETPAR